MKFLPELGLCFGGTVVTPAMVSVATQPQQQEEIESQILSDIPHSRRRLTKVHSTKLWRPALSVIAEDGVVLDERRKNELTTSRSEKKPNIKAKSSNKTRSPTYGDNYRKSCHPMALPAFSPTPFLF